MAKIKVKQIEDLSLDRNNSLLTVGAGKVEFSTAPQTGGYVSGFSAESGVIKPIFTALPLADIFSTGLLTATNEVTGRRTITLDDAHVRSLFDIAASTDTPAESTTFVTGITYNEEDGKFTYTTGTTVSAKDGKLSVKFGTGETAETLSNIFSANTNLDYTLELATVAKSGAAKDVTVAAKVNGETTILAAGTVQSALETLAAEIDALDAAQLSAGKGIDIDGTTINADLNLSIGTEITGEGESAVTTTYLYIKDTEGNEISKVDAAAFVKDGFLKSVTKDAGTNELVFTWNTDAEAGEENQVTRISISDLCDVYTADETYLHLNGYKFEHKTQENLTATQYGADAAATLETAGESITFNVPSITVDAAGHVTGAEDKEIKVALPAAQTVTPQTTDILVTELKRVAENGELPSVTLAEGETLGTLCAYLNGQLLPVGSVTNTDGTLTLTSPVYDDVTIEDDDRVEVVYEVKKTITVVTGVTLG